MKIAHLADIQVRAHSRHDEYIQSFEHLYKSLREKKPDRIVLAGDIVHNKTNISPELVDIVSNFLRSLCLIAPVDMILGNHDLAMKNMEKMDALTPIVNALNNNKLNFYRKSCVVNFSAKDIKPECQYVVLSCVDSEETWKKVTAESNPSKLRIALWHGTINGVSLESGRELESAHSLEMFDGMDYVMLGDIHATQVLGKGNIAYPGSYPKQSYGEDERGGYFLWDISGKKKFSLEFVELPTVCPFYTIHYTDQESLSLENVTKGSRIRMTGSSFSAVERKQITDYLNDKYKPSEIKFHSTQEDKPVEVVFSNGVSIANLREPSVQEKLLREYFKDKDKQELDQLCALNRTFSVPDEDTLRNVRYRIKSLDFANLFSFGPGNLLDLTIRKGILGIFGKNAVGKSTLAIDALMYAMFNKVSKDGVRNQDIINHAQKKCRADVKIAVNDHQYDIARTTERQEIKKRNGSIETKSTTDVSLKKNNANDGDTERATTDKQIRKLFGTADDFMLTSVAAQFDLLGFVADKATDRKKTISRYFDLEFFEQKHQQANDQLKLLKGRLKLLQSVDYDAGIAELEDAIEKASEEIDRLAQKASSDRKLHQFGVVKLQKIICDDQSDADKQNMQAAAIKNEFVKNRNDITALEEELEEFKAYTCLDSPDCCLSSRKVAVEQRLETACTQRDEIRRRMSEFLENQKETKKTGKESDEYKKTLQICNDLQKAEKEALYEQRQVEAAVVRHQVKIESLERDKQRLEDIKSEFYLLDAYVKAMGKDGLSFQIISNNLRNINDEIARILNGNVDFDIWLKDEEKEIVVYLQHVGQKAREIELCSGMEKTIASIVIRAALISVTSLPVSNIFVLDESFTSLDNEHMHAMGNVLSGLKRVFDTIIVICHGDAIRDLCDHVILVEKNEEGYAKLVA